jgi:tetratricopeptide (TPR) repeat protein
MALLLGEAYRAAGDRQRASKTLNKVRGAAVSTPLSYFAVRSSRLLGEIALEQGNTGEAETLLRTAIDAARSTASANELGLALGAYGRLQQALGDLAAAREHIGEALEILERLGTLEAPSRLRSELKGVGAVGNRPTEIDHGA